MITLRHIKKSYVLGDQDLLVLDGVDIFIKAGECVSIMGASGSGKSTMLSILGCLDNPDSGTYILNNQDISLLNENQLASLRNQTLGFVFQNFNLISHYSVLENVALPLVYSGIPKQHREKKAFDSIESLGLAHRIYHLPNQLSGGERQRVAIARALITDPSVILADEPTGNLDSDTGSVVLKILKSIHDQGKTVILVTHDLEVASHTDRIITIKNGKAYDC